MSAAAWAVLVFGLITLAALFLWVTALSKNQSLARQVEKSRVNYVEAGQSLAAVQGRLMSVLEGCGAGVIAVDRTFAITLANNVVRQWLGHDPEEIVGRSLIQGVLSDELQNAVRSAFESCEPSTIELREIGPAKLTLLATILPRCEVGETLIFAHDVTEFRRLETIRQDFVANVSHELRTPLASIRAMSETLESGAVEEEQTAKRFLNTIISEADRLGRIADDLLVLSRAESTEPERKDFDLSGLLNDVFSRFRAQAKREGIELAEEVPQKLELVANRDQIEEAVVNLVDNALKYTQPGGKVVLSAENKNGDVAIRVADTGIGIMQEDLTRIFERFFRVDKARSRRTGGTGLGLAIVKHIAEAHGGRIEVQSEFNRGSTFSLVLPRSGERLKSMS